MAKHKHEERENHERWLVSYADFITLLFAFFVVMYSISSVNEGKYRTVSESIKAALNPVVSAPAAKLAFTIGQEKETQQSPNLAETTEVAIRRLRKLVPSLTKADIVAPVVVQKINGDIVLSIPDRLLFNSGEATVREEALPFLQGVGDVLLEMNRYARVEGHTDNVPIRTAQFPSNWELSAARAVMVVRVLSELYGVSADHLAAVGYADTRPATINSDPEQRAKNRRVEVVILEQAPPAPVLQIGNDSGMSEQSTDDASPSASQPATKSSGERRVDLP